MYFHFFVTYLSLEKDGAFYLNKLESHLSKDALYQVWLKLANWFWRRFRISSKIGFFFVYEFPLFCYDFSLEKDGSFIWTNLNLLHPRMLCVKFCWKWPSGFGEEENVKSLRQLRRRRQRRRRTTDKFWSEKLTWES